MFFRHYFVSFSSAESFSGVKITSSAMLWEFTTPRWYPTTQGFWF
jgi:hypothetical protein